MTPCPTCGQSFDAAAAGGLCPACALRSALAGTVGETAGDYEELGVLGRGAMGVVTLARQRSLHRLVALKTIPAGQSGADDLGARLLREARAAAQLQHPHIVAVHDLGRDERGAYLAMEYCEGGTLRDRLRERPLPPREAAALGAKLAGALAHAHAAGVLHRDLKPSNVLLTAAGEPKLADFGLAGSTAGAGELTRVGEIAGSPSYLAPECLAPEVRPSVAVDVYGLGAVLYECVTGRPPFTGDSLAAVLAQVASAEPAAPRLVNRGVPADLDTIILKCLEKAPAARYADAAALRADLENFLAGRPIAARPLSPAGHVWRWARRNPFFAGTAAAAIALLATVAAGASVAALRLDRARAQTAAERDRAETALQRTTEAEHAAREQLRAALLAQAKATRFTAREGQRFAALDAVRRAAAIRPGLDARNEAVAALIRPDWSARTELKAWNDPGFSTATPLPDFGGFIHESAAGVFSRRSLPDGATAWTWPGPGTPSAGQTVVSPDGRSCAVRLQNDEIHVLDTATGAPRFRLAGRPFAFKTSRIWGYGVDMAFSPDGTSFAATRPEGGVSLHRTADGTVLWAWPGPAGVVSLAFAPSGRWLAAGGSFNREPHAVAVLDAADGRELGRAAAPSRVDFLAWSDDDRWLAVGARPVQVHAAADLSLRAVVPERAALHGRFLPDGSRILLSEQIGQTRLWDIDSGRLLLAKDDSGRPGLWYDAAERLRQWRYFSSGNVDLRTFHDSEIVAGIRPANLFVSVPSVADPLEISADGRWLLLGNWHGPVAVDLGKRLAVAYLAVGPQHSASVARFDPDPGFVWVGQTAGPLTRHTFSVGADSRPQFGPAEAIAGHDGFLPTALHRGRGVMALTNFRSGKVRLLATATRAVIAEWDLPRASHAAFSPDGALVVANAEPTPGARTEVREVATGRVVRTLGENTGRVAAWSADGSRLLLGTGERAVRVWRTADWTPGPDLPPGLNYGLRHGTLSPDGRLLVFHGDEALHVLRTDTGETLAELAFADSVRAIPGLRFSASGNELYVARLDGRIDVWDFPRLRRELAALGLDWPDP